MGVILFSAFVFCALLEFTFVNYMWRKQPPASDDKKHEKSPEAVNGKTVARSSDGSESAIAVAMVLYHSTVKY